MPKSKEKLKTADTSKGKGQHSRSEAGRSSKEPDDKDDAKEPGNEEFGIQFEARVLRNPSDVKPTSSTAAVMKALEEPPVTYKQTIKINLKEPLATRLEHSQEEPASSVHESLHRASVSKPSDTRDAESFVAVIKESSRSAPVKPTSSNKGSLHSTEAEPTAAKRESVHSAPPKTRSNSIGIVYYGSDGSSQRRGKYLVSQGEIDLEKQQSFYSDKGGTTPIKRKSTSKESIKSTSSPSPSQKIASNEGSRHPSNEVTKKEERPGSPGEAGKKSSAGEKSQPGKSSADAGFIPPSKSGKTTPEPSMDGEINNVRAKKVVDTYNTEFIYYSSVLRIIAPALSKEQDRLSVRLWIRKLFSPEYHSTLLKPKRNRFLLYLTIILHNDETYGIFKKVPPDGALPNIEDAYPSCETPEAAWEMETQWRETLENLPSDMKNAPCYLHLDSGCPFNENASSILDTEFQFFLWLARPYIAIIPNGDEKSKVATWVQRLCTLAQGEDDCPELKGLRNDYMQALLGYVHDLRIAGPFLEHPKEGPIPPLSQLSKDFVDDNPSNDPSGFQANEFLSTQPLPETGAFAYINISGDCFNS